MFNRIKELIAQGPFVTIESELNKLIRNKTFIKASSMQINFLLWLQKSSKWQREWVLKNMQIPTEDGLKGLYEGMNRIEAENEELKAEILDMKKEFEALMKNQISSPEIKVGPKTVKAKRSTSAAKAPRKSKKLDNPILM